MLREDSQDQDFRMVMGRATDELPPLPDLVPGAVRQGRRRRIRSRAIMGAVAVGSVAAIAAPTLLLGPWAGDDDTARAGSSSTGELPLVPANWPTNQPLAAPTKAYPTVHVTESGKAKDGSRQPKPTQAQVELEYAFKQKVADVLAKLLPADAGEIKVPDDDPMSYLLVSGDKTFPITFRADVGPFAPPIGAPPSPKGGSSAPANDKTPPVPGNVTCAEVEVNVGRTTGFRCADGRFPDGGPISVGTEWYSPADKDPTPENADMAVPTAKFEYHGVQVMLAMFPDAKTKAVPAVNPDQLVKVVTDPTFLQVVDFWKVNRIGY